MRPSNFKPRIVAAPRRRIAYTLVEVMAVISLTSIVLGTTGALLHGVWRLNTSMNQHRVALDSISRLAERFRGDVHAAKSVEVIESDAQGAEDKSAAQKLDVLMSDTKRIVYQPQQDGITRTVRDGEQVVQRAMFLLPANCTVRWVVDAGQAKLLMSYARGTQDRELADRRQLWVDAAIGLSPQGISLDRRAP